MRIQVTTGFLQARGTKLPLCIRAAVGEPACRGELLFFLPESAFTRRAQIDDLSHLKLEPDWLVLPSPAAKVDLSASEPEPPVAAPMR